MADDQPDRVSVPTLVMTGGPLDGTAYPLALVDGETIVGSSMDAGVQIMLGNVEPFHARILLGRAGLAIEDAGSATGTFVNGEKVEGHHTAPGRGPGLPRPARRQGQRQAPRPPVRGGPLGFARSQRRSRGARALRRAPGRAFLRGGGAGPGLHHR